MHLRRCGTISLFIPAVHYLKFCCRFLYMIFIAVDACFRLKRKEGGSWETDPPMCDGASYFTESPPYRAHCNEMKDQDEVCSVNHLLFKFNNHLQICTCTGLAALDFANTKYSKGYSTTGVAMCTCGRHEVVMANGVGDMQKGERYVCCCFL